LPLIVAAVMFKVALPVLVNVTVCDELLPTFTLLKLTGEGLIANCACVVTAVPLSTTTSGDPGALLATDTLPVALPELVGANVAMKVAVWPGVSVCAASVLILKPVPLTLAPPIATLAVPVFVRVTFTDDELLIKMLPKLMLEGFALSAP
jgi:hypothetical protein